MNKIISLIAAFLLIGCASNRPVDVDYNNQVQFGQIKRYTFQQPASDSDPLHNQRIEAAINTQLTAKGWQLMPAGVQPKYASEVSVQYRNWMETRYKGSDFNIGIGLGRSTGNVSVGGGVGIPIGSNEQHVQIIRIDMYQQEQLIWRASDYFVRKPSDTPEERAASINQLVTRLLAQFPPEG